MKQIFFAVAVVAVLAACGPKQEAAQKGGETANESPASATAGAEPAPAAEVKGIDVLTGLGFKPDFAYAVVYDIVDKNNEGVNRHRVLLEALEGDIKTAMASAEATLVKAGYEKSRETESNGRYDAVFTKQGFPTLVFMAQTPERGPALKDPGAVGTIHIMWNFY
jgi:hypothetical protein